MTYNERVVAIMEFLVWLRDIKEGNRAIYKYHPEYKGMREDFSRNKELLDEFLTHFEAQHIKAKSENIAADNSNKILLGIAKEKLLKHELPVPPSWKSISKNRK